MKSIFQKIGLVLAGALLVALTANYIFTLGTVTPNSIITTQSVSTVSSIIATGDQTTAALFFAAGANGTKIYKLLAYPDTDGTSGDREITIYIYDGANSRQLSLTDVTGDSAAPVVPTDLLANVSLQVDSNGNKYLEIKTGYSIYISGENMTGTNPIHALKQDY